MDRESKRLTKTRAAALLGTVLVHGLIIIWALSINVVTNTAIPTQAIQVLAIHKPSRLHGDEKLSALQMNWLKPDPLLLAIPHINIPPPPQTVASEETADSNASVVASNGVAPMPSAGSGTSNTDSGDIIVAHRVQPIYCDASVKAREQGTETRECVFALG